MLHGEDFPGICVFTLYYRGHELGAFEKRFNSQVLNIFFFYAERGEQRWCFGTSIAPIHHGLQDLMDPGSLGVAPFPQSLGPRPRGDQELRAPDQDMYLKSM